MMAAAAHRKAILGTWLVAALVGCGGEATPTGAADAAEPARPIEPAPPADGAGRSAKPSLRQRCEALCARYEACGEAGASDCPAVCEADAAKRHAHQSAAYLWRLILCFDGLSCEAVRVGGGERACHQVAVRQLTPSEPLRRFCRESVARAAACGRPATEPDCLDRFRIMDRASLGAATACLERDCADIPSCFAESFGFLPADPR